MKDWKETWKNEYKQVEQDKMLESIKKKKFVYHITPCKHAVKRIVEWLICEETPFKIQNLGAGYKKISILDNVCPTCKGKGVVPKKKR